MSSNLSITRNESTGKTSLDSKDHNKFLQHLCENKKSARILAVPERSHDSQLEPIMETLSHEDLLETLTQEPTPEPDPEPSPHSISPCHVPRC